MSKSKTNEPDPVFTDILAGWDDLFSEYYQLKSGLNSKDSSRLVYESDSNLQALFDQLYWRLEENFSNGSPSETLAKSNWELRHALKISDGNPYLEKRLEKRVAQLSKNEGTDGGAMRDWYNQMPAASGYWSPSSNGQNCIDLIHKTEHGKVYRFIELKVLRKDRKSRDEPVYATFESLSYGFLYLLTRTNDALRKTFASGEEKPVLGAERIHLVVLAPSTYFEKDSKYETELAQFERSIDAALRTFAKTKVPSLEMSFEFRRFHNPVSTKEEIEAFIDFDPSPCGERLFPND